MIHISANKLAEFITLPRQEQKLRLVRQLRRASRDYAPYYACFKTPARNFLVGGASDARILKRAVSNLKTRTGTVWLERDSRVTTQALEKLEGLAPEIRRLNAQFVPVPARTRAVLTFADVEVTVTPDLLVNGDRNGVPICGSLRFYLAKGRTYQLSPRGAVLVAVMQNQWLVHSNTGGRTPDTSLSLVLECFQERLSVAPSDVTTLVQEIERGAREVSRIWHGLDGQQAA